MNEVRRVDYEESHGGVSAFMRRNDKDLSPFFSPFHSPLPPSALASPTALWLALALARIRVCSRSHSLSLRLENTTEGSCLQAGERAATRTVVSNMPVSRTMGNKLLLFKLPSLQYFVMEAQVD